ncbi:hypothetical protein [Salinibacter grassmerensis]|uniref:hypothetical protein n=1 Tax=Salinibacter grassmerensis TaxID=3040353 RepID=UPI0021E96D71|nr:hypothetical protein [Salinibacter grassmerensis]
MHLPDHASMRPDHVSPIPMLDSKREAEMLCLLLDAGLHPCLQEGSDQEGLDEKGTDEDREQGSGLNPE